MVSLSSSAFTGSGERSEMYIIRYGVIPHQVLPAAGPFVVDVLAN